MPIKADRKYHNLHYAVRIAYGKPNECEHCERVDETTRYEWAKVHDTPDTVDRENWLRLCTWCHHDYDNISEKVRETLTGRTLPEEVIAKLRLRTMSETNKKKLSEHRKQVLSDPEALTKWRANGQVEASCEICGRICKNLGALGTHRKSHKEI